MGDMTGKEGLTVMKVDQKTVGRDNRALFDRFGCYAHAGVFKM